MVAFVCVVAGCGKAPWQQGGESAAPSPSPPAATPIPKATTPTPTSAPAKNDLSTGSAKRTLEAGGIDLKVNYWSTLDVTSWTAEATKPLNLAATAKFQDGSKQDIYLTKVTVAIDVTAVQTPVAGPDPLVDEAKITPGYLIKAPTSYGQVFPIPALEAKATSVTLTITYELLAQSAPKEKKYAKQTATDTLVIALHS